MNSPKTPELFPDLVPKSKAILTNSCGNILLAAGKCGILNLPGGGIEGSEPYEIALVRELGEELSLSKEDITKPEYLRTVPFEELGSQWLVHGVSLLHPEAVRKSNEISWIAWMSRAAIMSAGNDLVHKSVQDAIKESMQEEQAESSQHIPAMRGSLPDLSRVF